MPVNPRRLVVRALARLERTPQGAGQAILRSILDGPDARELDVRDRALITTCFYGVLRWRLRLDYHINKHAKRGVPSDPELANILRLGTFQLLFLDRVPDRAAVHTAVNLARKLRGPAVSKFVNGVLRAIGREPKHVDELAIQYGHPQWMVDRLAARLGDGLEARLKANMTPPPVHLRIHPKARAHVADLKATPHPDVFIAADNDVDSATVRRGIRNGFWLPQDRASVEAADLLRIDGPGLRVLEICCGRGVKTTRVLERCQPHGGAKFYLATDVSVSRLHEARRLSKRWLPEANVHFLAADASSQLPIDPDIQFDRILIDAPCSGLGVIRRRPEILWRRTEEDVATLATLQQAILMQASKRLAPGGQLIYAVCTLTQEETTGVLDRILHAEDNDCNLQLDRTIEFAPERDGCDGFFGAVLTPK